MKRLPALPLIALALVAPASAQQSVRDFQLPPAPTPSSSPAVQGPVDVEGGVPIVPRAIPTASPTPAPSASATPTPAPSSNSGPASRPAATPTQRPAQSIVQRTPSPAPASTQSTAPTPSPSPEVEPIPASPPELPAAPEAMASAEDEATTPANADWPWWFWLAGGLGLLVVLAGGWLAWRRRGEAAPPEILPPIPSPEPQPDKVPEPTPAPAPAPDPAPATAQVPAAPVSPTPRSAIVGSKPHVPLLEMETVALSRSIMAIRMSYRLRVTNRAGQALEGLRIEGELAAAHGSVPLEQQRADATRTLPLRHELARLEPSEMHVFKGEMSVPLAQIQPVMQGNVPLLVPLLLWRCVDAKDTASVRTFLLGEVPETIGTRLRPLRLDLPPQGYPNLGLKALD